MMVVGNFLSVWPRWCFWTVKKCGNDLTYHSDCTRSILSAAPVEAMKIATFYTSLTDAQWAFLKRLLPERRKRGRPPTDRRQIIDALLYVIKGGIPWRLLPAGFPPWKTVYHIFRQWTLDHTWESLNARLRAHVRTAQ